MFQAGAVTECAAALLSFRYPSFRGKPEQNITTKIHAKRDDGAVVWHPSSNPQVLCGAMHSGFKWRSAVWVNAMHSGKK